MKARILIAFVFIFLVKTNVYSQFTGGVQDGYASGTSIKKIIADTIVVSPIPTLVYCAGAAINIDFFARITFNAGNIFTAQLSDASGSFASPVSLGTLVGTTSGTINGTIPLITPAGIGYRVRVVSSNPFFISQPNASNITVKALPVITASSNSPICEGAALNLTSSLAGADSYSWTGPNTFTDNVQNPTIPAATAAAAGVYNVSATVSGCSNSATSTVVINASPGLALAVSDASICNPAAGNVIITVTNAQIGYLYELRTSGGVALTPAVTGIGTGANLNLTILQANAPAATTTYSVYASIGACTALALTDQPIVSVTAAIPQTITGTTPLCIGATNIYTSTTAGGAWSSGTPANATVNAVSGLVTGVAAGTSIITYSLISGSCTNTATKTVTIDAPIAQTITGTSPLCIGATNIYTSTTPGGAWSSGTPANATVNAVSGLVTGVAAGTSIISYSVVFGACTNTATKTVTIEAPVAQTITGTTPLCIGATNIYTSTTPGGAWSSGTPANATVNAVSGLVTGVAAGTSVITYSVVTGSCTNTATKTVTIQAPVAQTITGTSPLCIGATNIYASTTPGGAWSSGTPVNATVNAVSGLVTGVAAGTSIITYTVVTGVCTNTATKTVTIDAPIAQTITGTSPLCIGATNIYTSTTPGGAWSSGTPANATVNAISGLVTGVAAGTSIITYTVSTGACTNIGTKTVTISSPIAQTITGASPLCVGQTSLYSSTTAGGTWSSGTPANATVDAITGLVTGVAAGTSIINYSVITGACTNTANFTVTVNPSPVITASSNSPLCEGQNLNFNLVAPGATSYIWAGPNSFSDNVQNPTIASITSAAAGIYSVTATIASCSSTTTTTVVVNPLPSLTFVTFLDTCLSVAPFPMYGATPAGGAYSGTGISGVNFDPLIAGLGFHPITYTYTDPISSCSNSIVQNVFVNDVPTVILNTFLDTCLNVVPFALFGGSPVGGVYSGPGVDAAGIFDPSIAGFGPQVINYTYTTPDGCVNSTTQNVTIFDVPVVTLNTFTDTCISTADFALYGGFPITDANGIGVYSGTGVDGLGVFSPADAGVGTHLITYTYTTALGGCVSIATQNVVVDSLPIVTFTSFIDTCTTVIPFTLSGGLPLGGIYSGIGITANVFNPLTVGADTIQLTYTYTDSHGCSAFATDSSIVVAAPIVSFTSFTDTCISVLPFSLTGGLPAGGVYSGLGVNSGTGIFDPMIAGAGSDTLVYTYTDITGCSNIAKDTVVVNALPIVTITTFADTCINIPAFNLFGGLPAGGTYSGIGVNSGTGIFDPMIAGAGNDTIFYTYTDLNGCANVDSQTVVVFAAPIPNAGPDIEICFGMDTVITASGGLFYQWTPATGLNASNIANPIASPDLTTTYIVAVSNAQGCIASDTMVLTVHPLPIVNAGKDTVICFGNSVVLNASATGTLTYVWTPSDSLSNDSIFNPIANPTTSITYLISVIDSNGCVGTDNISIGVKPLPFVELNSDAENNTTYTGEVVTFTSTPAGYVNYQFFVNGSSMLNGTGNLYLTSALENGQLVNVIVTENGCSNSSDTLLMTVRDLPNAFTPNGDSQNDRFAKGIDLEVFNRWGQLIYKGIDGWDGKFNGKVVAPETYFYVATLYDVSDNKTVKKGTISVVAK